MTVAATHYPAGRLPNLFEEIAIDLFAGGGGMSRAWEIATGRCVDEAVNHDADAIWMHTANHPNTRHWRDSVWEIDPHEVAGGRPVGWLHGSPDCTHFSIARGGKPVKKEIRGLAWCCLRWVAKLRPRLFTMENVREFMTWGILIQKKAGRGRWLWEITRDGAKGKKVRLSIEGPHTDDGSSRGWISQLQALGYSVEPLMIPDRSRSGETFKAWKRQLEDLGYKVEYQVLDAADYGAPTHRRRLFIVARRDGLPIRWPEKTHGTGCNENVAGLRREDPADSKRSVGLHIEGGAGKTFAGSAFQGCEHSSVGSNGARASNRSPKGRTKRDWRKGVPKLKPFRTAAECIDFTLVCPSIFTRKKDLAENTLRRIVRGLVKFSIDSTDPFIVQVNHGGDEFRGQKLDQPLPVISSKHGFGLTMPFVAGCGGRAGQSPETPLWVPVGTITGKNDRVLIAPHLTQYNGLKGSETRGVRMDHPLNALPTENRFGLASAFLTRCAHGETCASCKSRWGSGAHDILQPLGSLTGSKDYAVTSAFLYDRHRERAGQLPRVRGLDRPLGVIDATGNGGNLASAYLFQFANSNWSNGSRSIVDPMPTLTALPKGGSWSTIAPYLVRHRFGEVGWTSLLNPLQTICAQGNHFSVITPHLYTNVMSDQAGQRCDRPLGVITSVHNKFQFLAPMVVKFYGCGENVLRCDGPLDTITGRDRFAVASAHLTKLRGIAGWSALAEPLGTVCAGAATFGLTTAWLVKHYGGNYEGSGIDARQPLDTITAVDHHGLGTAFITQLRGTHGRGVGGSGLSVHDTLPTITAGGGHLYVTEASLIDPLSLLVPAAVDQSIYTPRELMGPSEDPAINRGFWRVYDLLRRFLGDKAPLPIVRKDGVEYLIYDIGMRMLTPRELLNAQFGPELAKDYILTGTRECQVAKIGNSVPPLLGAPVIRVNWFEEESGVAA